MQRKTEAPFFIDKMPNNCLYVGLIQLILPNAKIIDARRHPLGCCFSVFKQHFARGQNFAYDLDGSRPLLPRLRRSDGALRCGAARAVHRVFYESMVEDTEAEVRRLLDYCGLPFEEHCLRFYENERAVRTASSEQVRQPIFTGGMDHWRHFEPWLGPLKEALGAGAGPLSGVPNAALSARLADSRINYKLKGSKEIMTRSRFIDQRIPRPNGAARIGDVAAARSRRLPLASAISAILAGGAPVGACRRRPRRIRGTLEEVVVTAQKRRENLQNVPISIEVLDNTKLEQLNIVDLDDYVKYSPERLLSRAARARAATASRAPRTSTCAAW